MKAPKRFDTFFRTHYERVCKAACRNGVPATEAEDVAQEAFLAFTKLQARYPNAPPERLLGRITKNQARNFRRTDPRRKPLADLQVAAPVTPEQSMRYAEGRALMARLIRELPEDLRRVYMMADIEGMELAEIAERLGIPLGTVKSRLHAARAAIDAMIQQLGRNNELPAILLPLFFGRGHVPWTQKLFGCLRPLTIGMAACFLVPSIPGLAAEADVEIVAAPDVAPAAAERPGSMGARVSIEQAAGLDGDSGEPEQPMPAGAPHGVEPAQKASAVSPGGGSGNGSGSGSRNPSSEPDRRALEMIALEEIERAYFAQRIERAENALADFDARYPEPYLSAERDELGRRIRQAKAARVRVP